MFVTVSLFHTSLKFAGKGEPTQRGLFLALLCSHILDLDGDEYSSLLQNGINYGRKAFYSRGPRVNVIKLYTDIICECL